MMGNDYILHLGIGWPSHFFIPLESQFILNKFRVKKLHELNLKISLYRIFGLTLLTSPSEDKL